MKKTIISLFLALVMLCSAFVPAIQFIPAAQADALNAAQNAHVAPVQVSTLGELAFALENSDAKQTITLAADIKVTDDSDWQMDIRADGLLVLDLNGYDIELNSANTAVLFNITNSTVFHLVDSKAKISNLGSVTLASKVKNKEVSVIAVNHADAKVYLHDMNTLFLKPYPGDTQPAEKASVIRIEKFNSLQNYGTNLNCSLPVKNYSYENSLGVAFYPHRDYPYDDSDFGWYKGNIINNCGSCFNFDVTVKLTGFLMETDFIRFGNITMNPSADGYAMNVHHNDSTYVEKFFMTSESKMNVKKNGTVINNTTALNTFSKNDDIVYTYTASCSHTSKNDILSWTAGHAEACSACGKYFFENHTIGTPSAYVEPTEDTFGYTSGVSCTKSGCSYTTTVRLPKVSASYITGSNYFSVSTYEELQEAFRDAPANTTIALENNIEFKDTHGLTTAVLRPQTRGRLLLDMNGHNIIVSARNTKYLIDLSMYDPLRGATSLYIVNSNPDEGGIIKFSDVDETNAALVYLNNSAASLFVTDHVSLRMETTYTASDASVIYARRFRELRMLNAELRNDIAGSKGIVLLPGNNTEAQKAFVSLDNVAISAYKACIETNYDFNKYGEFKMGAASLSSAVTEKAINVQMPNNATVKDVVRRGFSMTNCNADDVIASVNKNTIEIKANGKCLTHTYALFVADSDTHTLYCTKCHIRVKEQHDDPVEATDRCAENPHSAGVNCSVCGYCTVEKYEYVGHEADAWLGPVTATCKAAGIKYPHSKCKHCGESIYAYDGKIYLFDGNEVDPQTDSHNKKQVMYKKPTCETKGWKTHFECQVCHQYFLQGSNTPVDWSEIEYGYAHDLEKVEGTATCTQAGSLDHYKCKDCNRHFWDEKGESHIGVPGAMNSSTPNHEGVKNIYSTAVAATCTQYGIKAGVFHGDCTLCGKTIILDVSSGSTQPKQYVLEEVLDRTDWVEPKTAHKVGSLIKGTPATCKAAGTVDHYECADCGAYCSDSEGKIVIADITAPQLTHDYKWVVVTPAQVGVKGKEEYKCKSCGDVKETREIPALEPEYLLGDVNLNGLVEVADARLALRASVGLETFTGNKFKAADTNKNGTIETSDARKILRAAVGLESLS